MDKVDIVYQKLLKDILENGTSKNDRTGTGTISVFSREVRFKMSDGFPLLTTKKIYMKGIIHELLWFLNGDTNIKYLVDNGVHIWDGDAYKNYLKWAEEDAKNNSYEPYSQEEFIEILKKDYAFGQKWGELGPIYGKQWVNWGGYFSKAHTDRAGNLGVNFKGINQITNLINELKNNPDSRRLIVNAWNVGEIKEMVLPPCHYGFELNTKEIDWYSDLENIKNTYVVWSLKHNDGVGYAGDVVADIKDFANKIFIKNWEDNLDPFTGKPLKDLECFESIPKRAISLKWIQRSVDTFLGLPFNIASYALLLHMIAKEVNMVPDELIGSLGDVHIYKNHIDQVNELLSREPKELPTLNLEKADNIFTYCYENVKISNYDPHPAIIAKLSN